MLRAGGLSHRARHSHGTGRAAVDGVDFVEAQALSISESAARVSSRERIGDHLVSQLPRRCTIGRRGRSSITFVRNVSM